MTCPNLPAPALPAPASRIRRVSSFEALLTTPWAGGVNALCWERTLPGDFAEVARHLGGEAGIRPLDEEELRALPVGPRGREAIEVMVADLRRLREQGLAPELNAIEAYPRDEQAGPVATDVLSFHADRAPIAADTWLCTYHGASTEGLLNEHACRRVDLPDTRAELLRLYGGADDAGFREYLAEHCYDLHYAPRPGAVLYAFGVGHLWRIALEHPGCPVPPCIHRAPTTQPGDPLRLLLIS